MITANEFQEECAKTAIYPRDAGVIYTMLGICNEAGELQGKYKKFLRDDLPWDDVRKDLKKELGDVLWYCAMFARELDYNLGDVMDGVLVKLQDRQVRGVLGGSGDNR